MVDGSFQNPMPGGCDSSSVGDSSNVGDSSSVGDSNHATVGIPGIGLEETSEEMEGSTSIIETTKGSLKSRKRGRVYCQHCDSYLSNSTWYAHKKLVKKAQA